MSTRMRVLVLGGTTEASRLAVVLAEHREIEAVLSLAGRTRHPAASPLPVRIGGFGGTEGLVTTLREGGFRAVIDATHPFAARISANAAAACSRLVLPRAVCTRPPWRPKPGDQWIGVPDIAAAVPAIGPEAARVFVTTGRLELAAFQAAPQHDYLIRTIDPPDEGTLPPRHRVILARGPFSPEDEADLMAGAGIAVLVTKNSGGAASAGKVEAARRLGVRVIVVERPPAPGGEVLSGPEAALAWLARHRDAP